MQLQSGTGDRLIRFGPEPDDVGPFYAYRGSEEVLGGWRERVFSDITYGEQQLAHHVAATGRSPSRPRSATTARRAPTTARIPRELLARALLSFDVVFTQDRSGFATPGATNPLGRIEVTRDATGEELHALLASRPHQR